MSGCRSESKFYTRCYDGVDTVTLIRNVANTYMITNTHWGPLMNLCIFCSSERMVVIRMS